MSEWKNWIEISFSPKGRIKRLPFLIGNVFLYLFLFIILFLSIIATKLELPLKDVLFKEDGWTAVRNLIGSMIGILYLYVAFILMIKRLRDIDLSPWLCLLTFIPAIGVLFSLYLLFARSAYQTTHPSNQNNYIDAV